MYESMQTGQALHLVQRLQAPELDFDVGAAREAREAQLKAAR